MIKKIDYGNFYCDIYGNIYNKHFKKLKTSGGDGYQRITLNHSGKKKSFLVHRLIADAFLTKDKDRNDVNHKNCIKNDNRAVNLEFVTKSENTRHMYSNKRLCKKGVNQGMSKLSNIDVLKIRELHRSGIKQIEISIMFNICKQSVSKIVNRLSWSHL